MTAPDKPGLSDEEFIPFSRGMVGEAIHACPPNKSVVIEALAMRLKEALDRLEALVKANEDRDLTPEEAQVKVTKRFGQGSSVQVDFEINSDWTWTKCVTLYDWEDSVIAEKSTFREAFASADKAEADREVGK